MSNKTIQVLLVDDDEDDFYFTTDYLRAIPNKTFDITWAKSFSEGLEQIKDCKFDVCFFDFLLGAKTGLDLLKIAMEQKVHCPIVLLTGRGDEQVDLEAMRLGAMDYLIKSELDSEKLDRTIRYSLERAEVLRRLRESETRLRGIFAQLKDAVLLKRPDTGQFFYYNQAALDLLGFDENEMAQKQMKDLLLLPQAFASHAETLQRKGVVENAEQWFLRRNGERVLCSVHATQHRDSEGEAYYLLVIQDITQRKKAERENLLAEKTASTARLVRTLAHEVRNPLTNINLAVDQLEPELTDEDQRLFADIIRRNGQRINELITELLNSFRPQETELQRVSVQDLLNDVLASAADRINLKKVTLEKEFGEDCYLALDAPKIKIALLNLVINALEAVAENTGLLTVATHVAGDSFYVEIADNGVGISPENQNRLFEPYFTSKTNGLGLGLTATLNILQSHQATVEVESEEGHGTTFTVTFPLGTAEEQETINNS